MNNAFDAITKLNLNRKELFAIVMHHTSGNTQGRLGSRSFNYTLSNAKKMGTGISTDYNGVFCYVNTSETTCSYK